MRPSVKRTVDPVGEVITLAEAKDHLRIVDDPTQDSLIQGIVRSAESYVETVTNRALLPQTWKAYWRCFPREQYLLLPIGPVTAVAHVKYTDSTGSQITWASTNYNVQLEEEPAKIWLNYGNIWPSAVLRPGVSVEVQFTAGYASAAVVPSDLKHAILLLIGAWYENPSDIVTGTKASADARPLPRGVDALIANYIIPGF
jgi:uncharacterized phiE125 gp8 family phage protein